MKKLLDSDWLRAVQFKCNTSAKYNGFKNHDDRLLALFLPQSY